MDVVSKCLDGEWIVVSSGWDWSMSSSDDSIAVEYSIVECNENDNIKWFNVRLDFSGRYLESSEMYDSFEDALNHRLLSDVDTIKVNLKSWNI